jgi:apolipoprotein N-acyltransferase
MFASFPPRSLWVAALFGVAILVFVVRGQSARSGLLFGYLSGLGFFIPLLPWVGVYVGAMPWLALSALEATAFALFGMSAAVLQRLPGAPIWIACAWTTTEALRARVPFEGFPWGRLAFGQTDGPLLALARLGGAPAVTFAVATIGATLCASALQAFVGQWRTATAWVLLVGAATALAVAAVPASTFGRSITVAVVQGNVPRLGLDFNAQRRAVLDNHVARTRLLAADVAAGRTPRPDLVIWPENSSDIDPLRNGDAAARIDAVTDMLGVPILVGAVLNNPDGTSRNTSIVWNPGTGPGAFHDKRRLVPFGEYLPLRPLVTRLSALASRVGNFVSGTGNGTVLDNGVVVGIATCYEVAFDDLVSDSVRAGAQLIAVPTNNATFGRTTMTYQQLAMSRLRAVEHDRSVVVAATSGVSAVVSPDGSIMGQTGLFTADTIVARVALNTDLTPAAQLRSTPEILAATVVFVAALAAWRRRWEQ